MSCFGCSKKYGLFTKEYGCPNCGYSYCAKCLKRPVAVPKHDDKVLNVCLICYDKLSKLQATEKVIDVEALPGSLVTKATKGLGKANISNTDINTLLEVDAETTLPGEVMVPTSPTTQLTTSTHSSGENSDITENLDSAILKRLKKLKTQDESAAHQMPSDSEIRSRLANLNDMPYKDYSKKDLLLNVDQRTDQEKMKDLLEQFMGEAQLDRKVETGRNNALSDIERRLMALRDIPVEETGEVRMEAVGDISPDTNTPSDNEIDDDAVLKEVMQKYLAEARLPTAASVMESEITLNIPPAPEGVETEELPWCNICNEDAHFRCIGCEGELFCAPCFRECHDDDEEYRNHVKERYSAPPKFVENHF